MPTIVDENIVLAQNAVVIIDRVNKSTVSLGNKNDISKVMLDI
jgi:hypothetical protein